MPCAPSSIGSVIEGLRTRGCRATVIAASSWRRAPDAGARPLGTLAAPRSATATSGQPSGSDRAVAGRRDADADAAGLRHATGHVHGAATLIGNEAAANHDAVTIRRVAGSLL